MSEGTKFVVAFFAALVAGGALFLGAFTLLLWITHRGVFA